MTADAKELLLILGVGSFFFIVLNIKNVFNKKKHNTKHYYMAFNSFLLGIMLFILFFWLALNYWLIAQGKGILSDKNFGSTVLVGLSLIGFISGGYAIYYKKKINNDFFLKFSYAQVWGAVIVFIALIAHCLIAK